ncbi:MAG: ACT domain-containing protein [Candidatus Kariarchaeaceae archaeon]|jgi:hypothetical protein
MKNLTIVLEDKPGSLARLGETLGNSGVNIEGISGSLCMGRGVVHILVEDYIGARKALEEANIAIQEERDIIIWDMVDKNLVGKPGALGEITRRFADAGVNINLLYNAENNRTIIGVDDLEKAKSII